MQQAAKSLTKALESKHAKRFVHTLRKLRTEASSQLPRKCFTAASEGESSSSDRIVKSSTQFSNTGSGSVVATVGLWRRVTIFREGEREREDERALWGVGILINGEFFLGEFSRPLEGCFLQFTILPLSPTPILGLIFFPLIP